MIEDKSGKKKYVICEYCGSDRTVRFPCCGYFCVNCGKGFEEEDIDDLSRDNTGS